jgi:hypothetical protein
VPDLLSKFLAEWAVIQAAPISFFMSLVFVGAMIWWAMSWGYGRENSLLRQQVTDYKDKLSGATPTEARSKIEALETELRRLSAWQWPPVTPEQSEKIKRGLKPLGAHRMDVFVEDRDGRKLMETLVQVFDDLGWNIVLDVSLAPLPDGLRFHTADEKLGRTIKEMIETHTDLEVLVTVKEGSGIGNQLMIGIRPEKYHA